MDLLVVAEGLGFIVGVWVGLGSLTKSELMSFEALTVSEANPVENALAQSL